jgi:eukaryotic-like serine/threonine-protein kinase
MALASGTRLGPYEIVSLLGSGGMGEVSRAKDTRLGREVAVKVLPDAFAKDADRLRRFEQEARTVAALNHPNILGIHDIGTHEGRPYLVSELLVGETLREKVDRGPIAVKRAIEYAKGVALGLAAAHNKGIVHRDLKPENVFVTRDGHVKVLDFGLAKLILPEESVENAQTMTSPATMPGMVMGTMGYMSPEQVKGETTDARSDIFSFGAVLYEMLTGKRAFRRDTGAETMTAILREEVPELAESGWQGPPALEKILHRCMEKSPERRFQSASDLGFAIESLSGTSVSSGSQVHRVAEAKRNWWPWLAGAAALIVVGVGAWFAAKSTETKEEPTFKQLTYDKGYLSNARFAKDGGTVLYSARWNDDPDPHVYSVRADFPQSSRVDLPAANLLSLSANGEAAVGLSTVSHANFMSGTLAVAPMMGGTPRVQLNNVISADFAPDGRTFAVARLTDGKAQLEFPAGKGLFSTSGYIDYVRISPNGKSVACAEHPIFDDDRGWIDVVDEKGKRTQLTPEYASIQGLVWSKSGKEILYTASDEATNRSLYAVTLGGGIRLLSRAPLRMRLLDIAADGRLLLGSDEIRSEIGGIDPATKMEKKGLEWFDGTGLSDVRPDGTAFLGFEWGGPSGPLYMAIYRKLSESAPTHLGDGAGAKLSPDGTIAAAEVLARPPYIMLYPLGTGESRKVSPEGLVGFSSIAWFPDGKHLLLVAAKEGEGLRSYEIDFEGGKPQPVGPPGFLGFAVAGDGKRIAGINTADQAVIFDTDKPDLRKVPGLESDEQPGLGPDLNGEVWSSDGKALILAKATLFGAEIFRLDVETGKRAVLKKMELSEKAGTVMKPKILYAEKSNTYVYRVSRIMTKLYVVEGLK